MLIQSYLGTNMMEIGKLDTPAFPILMPSFQLLNLVAWVKVLYNSLYKIYIIFRRLYRKRESLLIQLKYIVVKTAIVESVDTHCVFLKYAGPGVR